MEISSEEMYEMPTYSTFTIYFIVYQINTKNPNWTDEISMLHWILSTKYTKTRLELFHNDLRP